MATLQSIANKHNNKLRAKGAGKLIKGELVEMENESGGVSVKVEGYPNIVWVRLLGQDARIDQAYNIAVQPRNKTPVWLQVTPDDELEVVRVRGKDGSYFFGEAAPTINLPEIIGELLSIVWPGRNLKPGRIRLDVNGGMYLWVEAFHHNEGYFPGGRINLTGNIPATVNTQAWVRIYIDPSTNAVGATTGAEFDSGFSPMDEADLDSIVIDSSYIPVGGVVLHDDTTALDSSTLMVDDRQWINAPRGSSSYFPVQLDYPLTIPANGQIPVRRLEIVDGGILTVNGIIDIF